MAAEHRASVRGRHGLAPRHGALHARALRVLAVGVRVRGRAGRVRQEPLLARHRHGAVVLRVRGKHGDVPVHGRRVVPRHGARPPAVRLRRLRGQLRVPHPLPRHERVGRELEGGQHRHHRPAHGPDVEGHRVRAELHGRGRGSRHCEAQRALTTRRRRGITRPAGVRGVAHVPVHARGRSGDRVPRVPRLAAR